MTFQPGKSGNPAGRKAGVPNKLGTTAKEALQLAFEGVGGVPRLAKWAEENETEFYKLWSKILPQEVKTEHSGAIGLREWLLGQSGADNGRPGE